MLETTRPIGIVHIEDRLNGSETTSNSNATSYCKHDMTVSLYLPQRLHSNPPMAGIGAVSHSLLSQQYLTDVTRCTFVIVVEIICQG